MAMAGFGEKVHNNVYLVGGGEISHPADCLVYLIDGGNELALIDTGAGPGILDIVRNIQGLDFSSEKVGLIISTHAHIDHIGGNAHLQREHVCRIFAHELDADRIETGQMVGAEFYGLPCEPCTVNHRMSGAEEELRVGDIVLNVIHIPGHTPGSIALWTEIDGRRILFGQDLHGPYVAAWGAVMDQVRPSLEKMRRLNADILCEGHFGVFRSQETVSGYIDQFLVNHA
jgi:glyoxylase-like metal-dependent hydrolase (beta-lactamase superfamily II)